MTGANVVVEYATSRVFPCSAPCAAAAVKHDAHLIAFDLIELDGRDLRWEPIEVRKTQFARLAQHANAGLQLCEHIDLPGDMVLAHA